MSLTRRHFLGLLGAAPALAPVAALAVKREPEPKFPRWFLVIDPRWIIAAPTVACILVSAPDRVYSVRFDGQRERRYCYDLAAKKRVGPTRLDDVFEGVSLGLFREITAAEAEALLKPQYDHPSCTLTITKDTDWDDVDEESLRLVARAKADLIMSAASITMKRGHEA